MEILIKSKYFPVLFHLHSTKFLKSEITLYKLFKINIILSVYHVNFERINDYGFLQIASIDHL